MTEPGGRAGGIRSVGVEEEFLLVDGGTGRPLPAALPALARDGGLEAELQQEMIEMAGEPVVGLDELRRGIVAGRQRADAAARAVGARAVALATSPFPVDAHVMPRDRYGRMLTEFGVVVRRTLTCGMHVHVDIRSRAEGVAILDRIRLWLPVLVALAANSPFEGGDDTAHASYRYHLWSQWPAAGPTDVFGSEAAYAALTSRMLATRAILDDGMLYFDARLSAHQPTVEVRVMDVCATAAEATAFAGLVRALVETAAREAEHGDAVPAVPAAILRLTSWRAAASGLAGDLVHPQTGEPAPAGDVVAALRAHVRVALEETGDLVAVDAVLADLRARGTGADRQRTVYDETGDLGAVVRAALIATHADD